MLQCHGLSRVEVEKWQKEGRNIMAWTVNNNEQKQDFTQRGIPFFTDSAVDETEEAWDPPIRKITLSNIALTLRSML